MSLTDLPTRRDELQDPLGRESGLDTASPSVIPIAKTPQRDPPPPHIHRRDDDDDNGDTGISSSANIGVAPAEGIEQPSPPSAAWFSCMGTEYEIVIGRRYRISLQLLDDLEVTLRFGLAIAGAAAILQFLPSSQLQSHFPLSFFIGIVVAIVFVAPPFLGTAIANSLSWVCGSLVGCSFAIITIEVLGPTRADNPSPVALGFIIFFVVFLLVYHGTSVTFRRSSTIVYCLFLALWYSDIKNSATVPGPYDFFLMVRTSWLGLAFALAALAVPLPQLGWPPLLPMPRMALPKVLMGTFKAADILAGVFVELARGYELGDSSLFLDEYGHRLLIRIENTERMLQGLQGLIGAAGRWEPFLSWPAPRLVSFISSCCGGGIFGSTLRLGNIGAVISNLLLMCLLQRNHINVMLRRADPTATAPWSRAMAPNMLADLEQLAVNVSSLLRQRSVLHTLSPLYDRSTEATQERERIETETLDLVSSLTRHMREHVAETLDETNAAAREIAFHCNALVRLSVMASTAVTIARVASEPPIGPPFAARVIEWLLEYLRFLKGGVTHAFRLVTLRSSPRKFIVHRHRRLAGSLLVSSAVVVACLFFLIDTLRRNVPTGFGVVTNTLILMDRDMWAANMQAGEQRLAGTALAIAGSFWLTSLWPNGDQVGIFLFIIAYCVVARFIQCNARWTQMAYSFQTALFLILFRSGSIAKGNVTTSATANAIATALGVALVALANLVWPIRSRTLIRPRIFKNLMEHFIPLVQASIPPPSLRVEQPTQPATNDQAEVKRPKLPPAALIGKLAHSTAQQEELIKEAGLEPLILRAPFPEPEFAAILAQQRRLAAALTPLSRIGDMLAAVIKDEEERRQSEASNDADKVLSSLGAETQLAAIVVLDQDEDPAATSSSSTYSLLTPSSTPQLHRDLTYSTLPNLTLDPFFELASEICERLRAIAIATKRKELTHLPSKRLYHSFLDFTVHLKSAVSSGELPPSVSPLLYAFAYQIRVAVFEIDSLRHAVDRLYESKTFLNLQPAIPFFALPAIRTRHAHQT